MDQRSRPPRVRFRIVTGALTMALLVAVSMAASAATKCVNPGGTGGCYSSINAAVAAAAPNDTVKVEKGTYHEDVVISKPLSLLGEGASLSVINAIGKSNGIDIDGHHNPGLSHVIVMGFTVANANFQGILITDASDITVANNHVTGNDRSLDLGPPPTCPGLPSYFQQGEGFDCGEGIHLSGVTHSTIASNLVDHNAGGILLSDDTSPTHDNLLSGNVVTRNPFDCGITLASHVPVPPAPANGVFRNTIAGNSSSYNGLSTGEGAGVGIFAAPPGARNFANVVIGNDLFGNGLPGVAMHSHSPGQNLNDNVIAANRISRNGGDGDVADPAPGSMGISIVNDPGAPPITGTVISQNIIKDEDIDIAVATDGDVQLHLNSLLGRPTGVQNFRSGSIDARENWWGCAKGPASGGCSHVEGPNIAFTPWLTRPFQPDDGKGDGGDDHHDDH